jgi:N6-adenosine-specific RNA methylase IME4
MSSKETNKKYEIIYADPPWKYDFQESNSRRIENHYETMPLVDIKNISVPSTDNAVCFLWVTTPKLKEGLEVLEAWGFTYRSCLVWDKMLIGTGYWFRGQHELLLIGVKGSFSPPIESQRISSVYREKRTEHSKKPNKIRYLISQWYPDKTKIELFAREHFECWDVWGNEIPMDTQKVLA